MKLIMKKTIMDYDLNNKKVIIRCDFNVPISDSKITDDTKIKEALDTIRYAIKNNAKVILMSHLGKVKVPSDKESNSLRIVAQRLGELLGQKVYFCPETHGPTLENMVNTLKDGEVLLMENTRFEDLEGKKESSCDLGLSKYWASLGELFINDAYGSCHRAHASVSGIPKYLDSGIGFLVSKEIKALEGILNDNTHPFVVIMGGKKISDKIVLTENLLKKCDILLVGGGMSNTYLKALNYNVGLSIYDPDNIDFCKSILEKYSDKIFLPIDVVASKSLDGEKEAINKDVSLVEDDDYILDIGEKTRKLFAEKLKESKRAIVNGPMGLFEIDAFSNGTKAIYEALDNYKVKTLIGGGDTAFSVNKLGFKNKFYHVSTGGGATLEYLEGKMLPGIEAIDEK